MPASHEGCQRFDLEVLLQVMERLREPTATVALHVCDGLRERVFYFVSGGVRLFARGEGADVQLVNHLLNSCLIDAETLQEIVAEAEARETSLRELVHERGVLSRDALSDMTNQIIRDEILDLVFWPESYCVVDTDPPKEIYSSQRQVLAGHLDCRELSEEVTAWVQLWSRSKPVLLADNARIVLTGAASNDGGDLAPGVAECLDWCVDEIELRDLWKNSGRDLPALCEELLVLVDRGHVLVRMAVSSTADVREALRKQTEQIEKNVSSFIRPALAREKLLRLYRSSGQEPEIVNALHLLASEYVAERQSSAALARLREIVEMEVENVEAHEQMFRILIDDGNEKAAVAQAGAAAEALLEEGFLEEARFVARLLASSPLGLLPSLVVDARALEADGQVAAAAQKLATLAEEHAKSGQEGLAIEKLEHAARLDSGNAKIAGKLRAWRAAGFAVVPQQADSDGAAGIVGQGDEPAESRRRRRMPWVRVAALAGAALVVLLIAGFWNLSRQRSASADRATGGDGVVTVGTDETRRRLVDEKLIAEWEPGGEFRLIHRWSGKIAARLPGRDGAKWAIGFRAARVCLWEPGRSAVIYSPSKEPPRTLTWSLPDDVAAVAVGEKLLALRRGQRTFVHRVDGNGEPISEGALPIWTEGLFANGSLLLQSAATDDGDTLEVWGVRHRDSKILWTGRSEFGALMFR